mgnify:FL=1
MSLDRTKLPATLYTADQCRALDRTAIEQFAIPGFKLMQRAGHAAFVVLHERWSDMRQLTVLCGGGNNGGDGFVMAVLAQAKGIAVQVICLGDEGFADRLRGEALEAWQWMSAQGIEVEYFRPGMSLTGDVVVDAMLGTGLGGEVRGQARQAIDQLNRSGKPVLAVDIPSGLCSDTGAALGSAVCADCTVTFIGVKQGLLTHEAVDHVGQLYFDGLKLPEDVYELVPVSAFRTADIDRGELLPARARSAHKGTNGRILIVGGDLGMGGAALMAAEAAARTGAGLISLATCPEHVSAALVRVPEVMAHGISSAGQLEPLLDVADVIVVGPGLGRGAWGQQMLQRILATKTPLVMDADALNLICLWGIERYRRDNWILTPHPGEAGRLLDSSVAQLQQNRFQAVAQLQDACGGSVILKGAGTLVTDGDALYLCDKGNPGMAAGGMGDVLSGIIGALWAQGLQSVDAARMGVYLHAVAADRVAGRQGERGMMATDLIGCLPQVINGQQSINGS